MTHTKPHRPIRSFVKREGRMTRSQQQALDELWPIYGIADIHTTLDLDLLFPRQAPRFVEIGFGMGTSLLQMAKNYPDRDFIGIEVHRPGVGSTLTRLHDEQLSNLKIINHDAVEILKQCIAENSLDGVYLFFPDPWHKKKHHKRRIVQPSFVQMVHHCLKPGGIFHIATDWENYAAHIMNVMSSSPGFINDTGDGRFSLRQGRPETKYEHRGQRLGHDVWDIVFRKQ